MYYFIASKEKDIIYKNVNNITFKLTRHVETVVKLRRLDR